jgi:hypothetical protein
MLFKWTPNFVPNKIFVFGCGGTGSRVVPLIAQFMKSCPWVVNPEIVLVDFDHIEEKNLTRQNFIASDMGKNKATVLANRYSKAFNITITPITSKVNRAAANHAEEVALQQFDDLLSINERRNNIFILCVDSPDARRQIVQTIMSYCSQSQNNILIDAGNENDFGQVVVTGVCGLDDSNYESDIINKLQALAPITMDLKYIPMDPSYFDSMTATTTPSCAELDQTMAINTLMAVNIFGLVQNIYYVKPITFFRINVSMQHGSIPEHIGIDYFKRCIDVDMRRGKVASVTKRHSFHPEFTKLYAEQTKFQNTMKAAEEAARIKKLEAEAKAEPKIEGIGDDPKMADAAKAPKKPKKSSVIDAVIDELNRMDVAPVAPVTVRPPGISALGVTNLMNDITTLTNTVATTGYVQQVVQDTGIRPLPSMTERLMRPQQVRAG